MLPMSVQQEMRKLMNKKARFEITFNGNGFGGERFCAGSQTNRQLSARPN
jgi:hypothetical protein